MLTEYSLKFKEGHPWTRDARHAQLQRPGEVLRLLQTTWRSPLDCSCAGMRPAPTNRRNARRNKDLVRQSTAWALSALLALALLSCSHAPKEPIFPATIAPGWTRSAVHSLEKAQFPTLLRNNGIERGWETEYRAADGAVAVIDAYAVQSNTQGLDLVQKWRPERNNAQFYTDHFLLNVAWQQAKHDELASLVRSLPKLVEGAQ